MIILIIILCCEITYAQNKYQELLPYIKKFEMYLGKKITKSKIGLDYIYDEDGTKNVTSGGVCYTIRRIAIINIHQWPTFTEIEKERIVFHELGHCELNRGHPDHQRNYKVPSFIKNNCPMSIMDSGTSDRPMTDGCYLKYYEYYINELFQKELL